MTVSGRNPLHPNPQLAADSTLRDAARAQMRSALREVLSLQPGCAPDSVILKSIPDQPLRIEHPPHGQNIGLSISHEAGLSVAALRRSGPVGVDILRIAPDFDWQTVARDYLGPQAFCRIERQPKPEQPLAFTREWTRFEAGLKCLGIGLKEWNSASTQRLESCRFRELALGAGLCGMGGLALNNSRAKSDHCTLKTALAMQTRFASAASLKLRLIKNLKFKDSP